MIPKKVGCFNQTILFQRGWYNFGTQRVRAYSRKGEYVDLFGVVVGPCSFYWTNPFVRDHAIRTQA